MNNIFFAQQKVIVYGSEMDMLREQALMEFLGSDYALPTFAVVAIIVAIVCWCGRSKKRR